MFIAPIFARCRPHTEMPHSSRQTETAQLLGLLAAQPAGIGIEPLALAMASVTGQAMPRRTLQRRLAQLVAQRQVRSVGRARAVRYVRVGPAANAPHEVRETEDTARGCAEVYVPTSAGGAEVKALVRRPVALRKPVGYQLAFLEDYHPNQSAYLPVSLREQLHAMGRVQAEQTPAGTFARDILNRLLIDLSWASSSLEGNTYSRLDTQRLLEMGQAAEGKNALETQMILNHKQAIEYLVLDSSHAEVSAECVVALHALLSEGLMHDPAAVGRLRRRAVEIGGSVYLPVALPQRVEELFGIVIQTAAEILDPFEQAFYLMVHLPYLQPFEDVNKRVSRLAANIPLIRQNLCPLSFIDVPRQAYVDAMIGVYELNRVDLLRDVFVWAYERSCQQYAAVKQNLVQPDVFRLRYRQALGEVVAAMVRGGVAATAAQIADRIPTTVAKPDHARFVQLVLREFESLHAGNAVRFGIRPLELDAWQKRTA